MRKRIQTNNDRKEERNAGRGYCCGLRTGTANGAVASVSVSWGIQGLLWGGLGRHPGHAEASFAVK